MAYQYVPLGFEMILSEENGVSLLSPGSGGGSWGLWFNVSLNDDPAVWDDEVKRLNQLQLTIPLIGDEQRLVRAQIAEFCRYHPLFPSSVDLSIRNVGAEKLLDASNIGCEGRGLLKTLGIQTEKMRIEQGKFLALNASKALRKAVKGNKPISPKEKKWSLLVRQIHLDKKGTISWLADILARGEPEAKSFRELCSAHGLRECEATPPIERPFNCLHCEEESSPCCFLQQTEATLICISETDLNVAGKLFRRFYEEYILAYCDALNSWLTDNPPVNPWSEIDTIYIDEEEAKVIAKKTVKTLGKKAPTKVWLAGCLLKTLKSNQRWHSHDELLDGFPDTMSWLE